MSLATGLGIAGASAGFGFVSALLPGLPAEAYVATMSATSPGWGPLVVVCVAVGQAAGKLLLFVAARKGLSLGRAKLGNRRPEPRNTLHSRVIAWGDRALTLLDRPWPAAGVILVSASAGVPPLAVTSVIAGLRRTPPVVFVLCCLIGRLARFTVIAVPVIAAKG